MESSFANNLEQRLQEIYPFFQEELVSSKSLVALRRIAVQLPFALSSRCGFETRLSIEQAVVDFLVCVTAENGERDALTSMKPIPYEHQAVQHPSWQRMRKLSCEWSQQESPTHIGISNIWLEFDVAQTSEDLAAPNIFFGLADTLTANADERTTQQEANRDLAIADTALEQLSPGWLNHKARPSVIQCFRSLPQGAKVFQVGCMLARETTGVRLCVRHLLFDQVGVYLARLGWSGNLRAFDSEIQEIGKYVDSLKFSLDVGEHIGPRIGIECSLQRQPQREPRWSSFLDYLVDRGLCCRAKADALLRWSGETEGAPVSDASTQDTELLFQQNVRALSHVKLSFEGDTVSDNTKAYFGVWIRQCRRSVRDWLQQTYR